MGASVQTQELQMRARYAEGRVDGMESLLQRGIGGMFNNPAAFFNRMSCNFLGHSCCGMPSIFGGGGGGGFGIGFGRFLRYSV